MSRCMTLSRQCSTLLLQLPSVCAPDTTAKEHGDGSHVKDANAQHEHVAEETLAVHSVAHLTRHDSESAVPVTAQPHVPPTCALVTEAVGHGDRSPVKDVRLPKEHDAVCPPCGAIPGARL